MVNKTKLAIILVTIPLAFIAGISVAGVIQSTERVGTSGIIVEPPPPPPPPPSPPSPPPPEPKIEIDVYSDAACSHILSSVEWGEIEEGRSVNRVIYIKNRGEQGVLLSLLTDNWTPSEAANEMQLSWDYDDSVLDSGDVKRITLRLSVDNNVNGIDSFNFDIIIVGSAL